MNDRDVWLVGLLAMAYLFLDARWSPRPTHARAQPAPEPSPRLPPEPAAPDPPSPGTCPRQAKHRVSVRGDGAIWCLACDEAFYPQHTLGNALPDLVLA